MREEPSHQTVLNLTAAIGPATGYLARRLFEAASREACTRCLDLLSYARWFTPSRVEQAAVRLMDYGIYEVVSLRFLLENDLDISAGPSHADLDGQLLLRFTDTDQSQRM
jgi:hypothetical protein